MKYKKILLILSCIMLLTFLRASIILLLPLWPFLLYLIKKYRVKKVFYYLLFISFIVVVVSIARKNVDLQNLILSLYIMLPTMALLFSSPVPLRDKEQSIDISSCFIDVVTKIMYIVNGTAFFTYYLLYKGSFDDGFIGIYGSHFNSVHGLSIINSLLFLYYFPISKFHKKISKNLINTIFFFISTVYCFYGLGLICLVVSIAIYYIFNTDFKRILKYSLSLLAIVGLLGLSGIGNLNYIRNNIEQFNTDIGSMPRKVLVFIDYFTKIKEEPFLLFSGLGPGAYNSRVAFLLNVESDNLFTTVLGHHMPYYHREGPYLLWNNDVVSYEEHTDGTRNKPFSSLLSILSEYGILYFLIFMVSFIKYFLKFDNKREVNVHDNVFVKMASIFMLLSLLTEMWLETSEFVFFAIFIFFIKNQSGFTSNSLKVGGNYEAGSNMGPP